MKNIAILAVHGVGHHEPRESATAIANLLLRTPLEGPSHYTSFREGDLQIPTRPLAAADRHRSPSKRGWRNLNEHGANPKENPLGLAPDHLLMATQLAEYDADGADGVYDTVRLEGHHIIDAGTTDSRTASPNVDANLHVYEFYWSDISRIGSSLFSVFGAFYQLVIHLPYIGRSTIEFASAKDPSKDGTWGVLKGGHTLAMRTLTLFIPVVNMLMLALGLTLLVRHVPSDKNPLVPSIVAQLALGVIVAVLLALLMYRSKQIRWPGIAILLPFAAGTSFMALHVPSAEAYVWLLFEAWAVAAFALVAVLAVFQSVRPGALPLGIALIVLTTGFMIGYARQASFAITRIVLPVLEWQYAALSISWIVFGLGLILVIAAGLALSAAANSAKPGDTAGLARRAKSARAAYTARFALALPAIAFCTATLLVWGLLVAAETKATFEGQPRYQPVLRYPALISHVRDTAIVFDTVAKRRIKRPVAADTTCIVVSAATTETLSCAPGYFIRTFAGVLDTRIGIYGTLTSLLALLILILVLGPVVWTEIQSPHAEPKPAPETPFAERSLRLGKWLNFGFGAARVSGELMSLACLVGFAGMLLVFPRPSWLVALWPSVLSATPKVHSGADFLSFGGLLLGGASTLGVLAVVHWLSGAGAGLRPALGIAADVDNYLRELPRDRTPRARLVERYASILRYICDWRADPADPDSGYDALIIIAHSQGTVITADLLRYLDEERKACGPEWEPSLSRLACENPLTLVFFTMGSPLRQLYAQRFPDLYDWTGEAYAFDRVGPDPRKLCVDRWVNAYRSADYVGRRLWGNPITGDASFEPTAFPSGADSADGCVGPGAHTHYWDGTADWIAEGLDELVQELVAQAPVGQ